MLELLGVAAICAIPIIAIHFATRPDPEITRYLAWAKERDRLEAIEIRERGERAKARRAHWESLGYTYHPISDDFRKPGVPHAKS